MRFLIITFFTLFSFNNANKFHDAVVAKFHVVQRGEVLFLEIEYDAENIIKLNNCCF